MVGRKTVAMSFLMAAHDVNGPAVLMQDVIIGHINDACWSKQPRTSQWNGPTRFVAELPHCHGITANDTYLAAYVWMVELKGRHDSPATVADS
jgi:hypothetical protein